MARKRKKKKDKEAVSANTKAALQRPAKKESKKEFRESVYRVFESQRDQDDRLYFPVTIIREGLGNLHDKNYYTEKAIRNPESAAAYDGAQAYYDHPTPTQERENPNRTVNELMGHYEKVEPVQGKDGVWELRGRLYPIEGDSRKSATELLEHAVVYKKKYPNKDFVGISINGDGEGEQKEYKDFVEQYNPKPASMEKLKQIEGESLNAITKLTNAFSADVVTAPGAGGAINLKEQQRRHTMKIKFVEGLKKMFSALEKNDTKAAEAAVKDMLQSEDENQEADSMEAADSLVKKMLQAAKGAKEEDESEEAYEKRVMAAMKKELEDYMAEDEDESEAEESEESEGEDESEAEEAEESEDDDGDDDADDEKPAAKKPAKKESAALKKLQQEVDALKADLAEAKKEGAKAQTELQIKNREAVIDKKLSKSGYRREITNLWRPVLEKCRSEKEMDDTLTTLREAAEKANSERFYDFGSVGLTEKESTETGSNDDLFLNNN